MLQVIVDVQYKIVNLLKRLRVCNIIIVYVCVGRTVRARRGEAVRPAWVRITLKLSSHIWPD